MATYETDRAIGWVTFSGLMLFMAGCFTGIAGIVALLNSKFYVAGAVFVFGDLRTWGWILIGISIVELAAAGAVFVGQQWSRWFGIIVAALNAIAQMFFFSAYPWWSVLIIGLNLLVIYGLAAYGTKIQALD
jgi:hypothetical protein